jgi:hypothetical protein
MPFRQQTSHRQFDLLFLAEDHAIQLLDGGMHRGNWISAIANAKGL